MNEVLKQLKVKKEYWDYISRYSLKPNESYIRSLCDILKEIQFKGFYRVKGHSLIKVTKGYSKLIEKQHLSHLVDIRLIKHQNSSRYYVRGDDFKEIFRTNERMKESKVLIYLNIKDDNGKKFKLPFKHESAKTLTKINEFNLRHLFTIDDKVFDPSLTRIFGDLSVEYGRFYAGYQTLSESKRKNILIDGEKTVERDYSTMHIRLLHSISDDQNELPEDIYSQLGPDRAEAKIALCIYLYSSKKARFNALKFNTKLTNPEIDAFLERVAKYSFLQNVSPALAMRLESEISLNVMSALISNGVAVLNIHDSFIVQQRHSDLLLLTMNTLIERERVREMNNNIA